MKLLPYRPRWMHHLIARTFGFFWIPCPNCQRMFGGHERHGGTFTYADGNSYVTCPKCRGAWASWKHGDLTPEAARQAGVEYVPFPPGGRP